MQQVYRRAAQPRAAATNASELLVWHATEFSFLLLGAPEALCQLRKLRSTGLVGSQGTQTALYLGDKGFRHTWAFLQSRLRAGESPVIATTQLSRSGPSKHPCRALEKSPPDGKRYQLKIHCDPAHQCQSRHLRCNSGAHLALLYSFVLPLGKCLMCSEVLTLQVSRFFTKARCYCGTVCLLRRDRTYNKLLQE